MLSETTDVKRGNGLLMSGSLASRTAAMIDAAITSVEANRSVMRFCSAIALVRSCCSRAMARLISPMYHRRFATGEPPVVAQHSSGRLSLLPFERFEACRKSFPKTRLWSGSASAERAQTLVSRRFCVSQDVGHFRIADKPHSIRLFRSCECNGDIPWSGLAEGFIPLGADGAKE